MKLKINLFVSFLLIFQNVQSFAQLEKTQFLINKLWTEVELK